MKSMKISLVLSALLMSSVAFASENNHGHGYNGNNFLNVVSGSSSKSLSSSSAAGGAGGAGTVYSNIKFKEEKGPASSAGTASSNTTTECRYLDQWAASIFLASASSTNMLRDLVCTLKQELNPLQQLALCIESGDYRQLRYYISTQDKTQKACPIGEPGKTLGQK